MADLTKIIEEGNNRVDAALNCGLERVSVPIIAFKALLSAASASQGEAPGDQEVRAILREHWITGVHCDHAAKTDIATCYCSVWRSEPQPSHGATVERWIDHVLARLHRATRAPAEGEVEGLAKGLDEAEASYFEAGELAFAEVLHNSASALRALARERDEVREARDAQSDSRAMLQADFNDCNSERTRWRERAEKAERDLAAERQRREEADAALRLGILIVENKGHSGLAVEMDCTSCRFWKAATNALAIHTEPAKL